MPRPETGSQLLAPPRGIGEEEFDRNPLRLKWELIADWESVEGGARPTEATITVAREENIYQSIIRPPYQPPGQDGGWVPEEVETIGPVWPGLTCIAHGGCVEQDDNVLSGARLWLSPNAGAVRVSYGRQALGRVVHLDLQSGRYYFGNCDYLRIEALRWGLSPLTDKESWRVSAHIGVAQGGNYDEAALTYLREMRRSSQPVRERLYPPPHARYFEPIVTEVIADAEPDAENEAEDSVFESNDPDFRYVQDQGQNAIVRTSTGLILPNPRIAVAATRMYVLSDQPLPRALWVGARFIITL